MSLGEVCLLVFIVGVILVIALIRSQVASGGGRLKKAYRELANRRHGTVQSGGWFAMPAVHFRHGSSPVVVRSLFVGGSEVVQFSFAWVANELHLAIGSNYRRVKSAGRELNDLLPLVESKPLFFCRGVNLAGLSKFYSPGVEWQLNRLQYALGKSEVTLTVGAGVFCLQKRGSFRTVNNIDELTNIALELFDQALLSQSVGIEFLESAPILSATGAKCQVCGETIETNIVYCRTCRTPHHRECWDYARCCSVFACRDTEFVTSPARPAPATLPWGLFPFRKPR